MTMLTTTTVHNKRIVIGSAQFGLSYGIANQRGRVAEKDVREILRLAAKEGVECIDTAAGYGDSEEVIGNVLAGAGGNYRIVSKLSPLENYVPGTALSLLGNSLERLRVSSLDGYLVHRFEDFVNYNGLWKELQDARQKGLVRGIGFSLYRPQELDVLLEKDVRFDIVQFPYSVFDRRFEPYFKVLKQRQVRIEVRSVFLQGLAFLSPENLPPSLKGAREPVKRLHAVAAEYDIPVHALCLDFVLLNADISRVLIGIDGIDHLTENLMALNFLPRVEQALAALQGISINDENILLPYRWKGSGS